MGELVGGGAAVLACAAMRKWGTGALLGVLALGAFAQGCGGTGGAGASLSGGGATAGSSSGGVGGFDASTGGLGASAATGGTESGGSAGGGADAGGSGGDASAGDAAFDAPTEASVTFSEPCGSAASISAQGLQYSGSVSLLRTKPGTTQLQRLSVSAPIHPATLTLYAGQGVAYPTTLAGQEKLAKDSALTFCFLIGQCAPSYPQIKTVEPLSPAELETNYAAIAECAYTQYGAKPYWIPQLLQDVEVCTLMLGTGWHMPTEGILNELTEAEYTVLKQKLSAFGGVSTYFNLFVWVRDKNGAIALGDMNPGVSPRVTPLPVSGDALTYHYESGTGLRCVKFQDL